LIVTEPTETAINEELPAAFARGITSFKVFMTYDKMIVSDEQFLDILVMAAMMRRNTMPSAIPLHQRSKLSGVVYHWPLSLKHHCCLFISQLMQERVPWPRRAWMGV